MTFEVLVTIGRMVIVGNEDASAQYVKSFRMSYSLNGNNWQNVTDAISLTEVHIFFNQFFKLLMNQLAFT